MAQKKSRQRQKELQKILEAQIPSYALLVFFLFASILVLSSAEHPNRWSEKDIIVRDISIVTFHRGSYYKITDENGSTYSISISNDNVKKLVCGERYHILHSHVHWNSITYMSDSNTVYVDYDSSVDNHCDRIIIGWFGIIVCITVALTMIRKSLLKIQNIQKKTVADSSSPLLRKYHR